MLGHRLKLARKRAGLSMQDLADRMATGVSAQAISKYEANRELPSSAVLVGLGRELGTSLDFLLGQQVQESITWRKNSTVSPKELAMAEALVIERLEDYLAIEDILDLHPATDPFAALGMDGFADEDAIEAKAVEVREGWQLGTGPIPSMTALLESKGLKLIEADLPERIDRLSCHVTRTEGAPVEVIVVSKHGNVEGRRVNLAHELGLRIIAETDNTALGKEPCALARHKADADDAGEMEPGRQRFAPSKADADDAGQMEAIMHRFAGAFLIPREHLIEEAGSNRRGMTCIELMRLKHTYGVSAVVMLVRLGQVGILSKNAVEYAFKTYARSWLHDEPEPVAPGESIAALEKPQHFERLIWRALGDEMISPVRAAQMLKLPLNIVERDIRWSRDQRYH